MIGWSILIVWALLTFQALYHNWRENDTFLISLDWNNFKYPMYELGISNRHWHDSNGRCVETYTLGFYFFNVVVDFIKVTDADLEDDINENLN